MKAVRPKEKPRAWRSRAQARHRPYAVYMYRLHRQIEPVDSGLVDESRLAPFFRLRGVGLEAARLAAFNRRGIITRLEIGAAMQQLSHRRNAVPMDGA